MLLDLSSYSGSSLAQFAGKLMFRKTGLLKKSLMKLKIHMHRCSNQLSKEKRNWSKPKFHNRNRQKRLPPMEIRDKKLFHKPR
jgi:hypothetical protein